MNGAGEGNRTLNKSLEGFGFTIKLHPHEKRTGDRANRRKNQRFQDPILNQTIL